ncbi:MAG: hypothetical protein ACFB9M_19375 [Myxococcota bacterium]
MKIWKTAIMGFVTAALAAPLAAEASPALHRAGLAYPGIEHASDKAELTPVRGKGFRGRRGRHFRRRRFAHRRVGPRHFKRLRRKRGLEIQRFRGKHRKLFFARVHGGKVYAY